MKPHVPGLAELNVSPTMMLARHKQTHFTSRFFQGMPNVFWGHLPLDQDGVNFQRLRPFKPEENNHGQSHIINPTKANRSADERPKTANQGGERQRSSAAQTKANKKRAV